MTTVASAPAQSQTEAPARGRVEMKGVSKFFTGSKVPVLEDVSLRIEPGEFVVVVGPSGCGKSTLLNLVAGFLEPDAGEIKVDDWWIYGPGPTRAMVFQDHALFPWLTAAQNIGFGLKMAGMAKDEIAQRVEGALKMVRLTKAGGKLVHELSGGMRQRVAIARALVMDPSVLLMDEPFAALDAQTRTLMHQQLQELWCATRRTVLFVTHSVGEAVRLADRIIVLHAHPGRIRREIAVDLAHPRDFDSLEISVLVKLVRSEIEDEVNRVNREMDGDAWRDDGAARLGGGSGTVGGGL
jgi:NitT/TauT family transport system ATP-binding protein